VSAGNIDRNAETVSAVTIRSGDRTAIVSPLGRPEIRKEALRQLIELIRHVLQRCGRAIDFGEFDGFAVLARQPHNVGRVRHEAGGTAVAVDLFEQWPISHTSRIEIDVRRKALLADGIFHQEHIFDVRIIEHRIERLGALAVVDAHARAVLPNKIVFRNAIDEIRIGLDERHWVIGGRTSLTLSETCSENGEHGCEQQR
jgi:hypothetical protein